MIELKKSEVLKDINTFSIGYCEVEELELIGTRFYTKGVYGWNCDVYMFDGFALTTGYRPFGKRLSNETLTHIKKDIERAKKDREKGYHGINDFYEFKTAIKNIIIANIYQYEIYNEMLKD